MENIITSADIQKSLNILRDQAIDAIRGILDKKMTTDTLNLSSYTKEDVIRYMFLECDNDGYGKGLYIDYISRNKEGNYNFAMIDEDEYDWGDRELGDFNTVELVWILEMLEDTFNAIEDHYNGIILPAGHYDYEYDKDGNAIGI